MTRNEKLIPVYWERMISLMPKKTVKKIHVIGHGIDASVDFSEEGMVHMDFTFLEVAARILAESSGEKESDIMNHILSPLFPDMVFTEDELCLLIVMSCVYGVTTLPYDLVDFINSDNAVQFDLDGALDSLIKKGFLSFDGKDITIHEDLPCSFKE